MLNTLAANGIGVSMDDRTWRHPHTLADMESLPAVKAILDLLDLQEAKRTGSATAVSPSAAQFRGHVASPTTQAARTAVSIMGFRFLVWLRHVHAHAYLPKTVMVDAGLTAAVVEQVAAAAVTCWQQAGRGMEHGQPQYP